jgi:hypothetical protein
MSTHAHSAPRRFINKYVYWRIFFPPTTMYAELPLSYPAEALPSASVLPNENTIMLPSFTTKGKHQRRSASASPGRQSQLGRIACVLPWILSFSFTTLLLLLLLLLPRFASTASHRYPPIPEST